MGDKIKEKQMTRWGVGPRFTVISCIYIIIILALDLVVFSNLTIPLPRTLSLIIGIILIIIGLPIFLVSGLTIDKYFSEGKLATKGIYAHFRHPIYGSWIVFIVPGLVLIRNSLAGFTVPFFMFVVFKILIGEEERYLEKEYGNEYYEYKRKVGAIFPKFHIIFNMMKNRKKS